MDAALAASPTAPRERGWGGYVAGLAAWLLLAAWPYWPASLALPALLVAWLFPIDALLPLLFVAVASCAVLAAARGGRILVAVGWVVLAWLMVRAMPLATGGSGDLARAYLWALAGAFGMIGLRQTAWPFLPRALAGVALALAFLGTSVLSVSATATARSAGPVWRGIVTDFEGDLDRRRLWALSRFQARLGDPAWVAVTRRVPSLGAPAEAAAATMAQWAPPLALVPGLLALESLAALALGWATWHRLSRHRIGPPLGSLASFRFSDHLVWGLVVGAVLVLPVMPSAWRTAGTGVLVFFGALHVLRGVGVLIWWLPERLAPALPMLLLAGLPFFSPVAVLASVIVLMLGLGLGDIWRDLRRAPPRGG